MKATGRIDALHLTILGGMFLAAAVTWPSAPDRLPIHWNAAGDADGYGGKFEALLVLPCLALAQYVLLRVLPLADPGRANYASFQGTYDSVRLAVLVLLAAVYAMLHVTIRGRHVDVALVLPILLGGLFVVLGNSFGKLRPNWFVGIRTPWTLSSKAAWTRTHRVGGWLMVALGLVVMAAAPFAGRRALPVLVIGGSVGMAVWSMAYSYWVWRHDPHKVPPAGTSPADPAHSA